MSVALLLKDDLLVEAFRSFTKGDVQFDIFGQPNSILEAVKTSAFRGIVVSDLFFDFDHFCEFCEEIKEFAPQLHLTVILSNSHDTAGNDAMMKLCLFNDITCINPGSANSAIVAKIVQRYYGHPVMEEDYRSRIVAFVGTTPNIGTTIASFGTAFRLALETNNSIAYLCLNLKSSKIHRYLGIERPDNTLDSIRAELKSQSLTKERLLQHCEKLKGIPNLYVLFGNTLRDQAEYFTPDDIEYLLRLSAKAFDLCIVEVNAYWDNAATICSTMQAGTRIAVASNEIGSFQEDMNRWIKSIPQVFGMDYTGFELFITQISGVGGFSRKDIRKEAGMNVIGVTRRHDKISDYLNHGQIAELFTSYQPIVSDLDNMINGFIQMHGLDRVVPKVRSRWLKRLLSGAAAGL